MQWKPGQEVKLSDIDPDELDALLADLEVTEEQMREIKGGYGLSYVTVCANGSLAVGAPCPGPAPTTTTSPTTTTTTTTTTPPTILQHGATS